jgi:outer membrane protein assembly factor BamD
MASIKLYIRPMKKSRRIDINLLITLILCLLFGDALAAIEKNLFQKTNHPYQFVSDEVTVTTTTPIEVGSKKKKTKTHKPKSKGKVSFETFQQNYDKAMKYYKNQSWLSAVRIFDELIPIAMGTPLGDTILFCTADCFFQNHDYQMASFRFREYVRRYPDTERTELAALNAVKSFYEFSPDYNLDKEVTEMAIDEVLLFIQQYPNSKYIEECNTILDDLRNKLAKKNLEIVRMYYNIGYYEATQIMVKNFLKSYASSKFTPEALYILVQNNYDFARKSVENKRYNRFKDCLDAFEMLETRYPESNFIVDAKKMVSDAKIQIKKIEEQKNNYLR